MENLFLAFCMGCYFWFSRLRFGYTISSMLLQPVVVGVFVGLLTSQMEKAMMIGAALQLVYLGVTSTPGGNVPNDPALAACISIPIGVLSNMSPAVAVTLAVPFGIIGAFVDQLTKTTNTIWVHRADRYAEEGNEKGIFRCAFLLPSIMGFIIRFPIVFIIVFYGVDFAQQVMTMIPQWLMHAFEIMGGILPALGFAITLTVIGKKQLSPFFIICFFMVKYFNLDIMAVAVFAISTALLLNLFLFKKEDIS